MGFNKTYRMAELLELCTEQNIDGTYLANDVKGMTITKEIIPTKADVKKTDLKKFWVIHPNDFIYNPRTHGKKIGFGFNDSNESFIISWNNTGFHVRKDKKDIVLPEYLFMHFNRPEWDREACYRSWGTSTEVFSWDSLCDMKITLPAIDAQRKAVAIYRGLKDNLATQEVGLADLKLTCDGYLDVLRHRLPPTKIGPYLRLSDIRNEHQLGLASVRGISTEKKLIETKANMSGISLANYKELQPRQFVYVADTSRRGDKVAIALNDSDETYLVSSIYTTFCTDETKLLPEYLMLMFHRSEFDRYARFHSWGSARETFDWSELCETEMPLPTMKVQRAVAALFRTYIERQRIADALRQQLKDICPILVRGAVGDLEVE
ncbi:hypothetical protein [Selenomonas sp.]|uniref:hypothetical protein n=1 Tax=Selenomonas sp. TaxID=2053611 RepID=UPI0025F20E4D|nr:hypothetical protein [Selenomonas sp.]MCI6283138.1 hypothetical protein [Selenomonas sp.]